jgi:hypothetical protein
MSVWGGFSFSSAAVTIFAPSRFSEAVFSWASPMPYSPFRMRLAAVELSRAVYELSRESREKDHMSISRLKDKLNMAAGVAKRAADAIEAEADALLAEEEEIKAKTVEAFSPHKAILAEARTELDAVKDALNLMSNGGPALDPLQDAEPSEQVASVEALKYPRFA